MGSRSRSPGHLRKKPVQRFSRRRRHWQIGLGPAFAIEAPGPKADDRPVVAQGERNFRQGAETATDGDDPVGGSRQDRVASLTDPGGDSHIDVCIGVLGILGRQEADRQTTRGSRATRCMFHDAGHTTAQQDRTALGNAAAHLEGEIGE